MYLFYIFATVPVIIGGVLWWRLKTIVWQEWLIGSAVAFLIAGGTHYFAIKGMTDDVETWSGQIESARKFTSWLEYYEEAIYRTEYYTENETRYRTVGSGKNSRSESYTVSVRKSREVFDHWEPRTRQHSEYHMSYSNIDTSYDIDGVKYVYFTGKFANESAVPGVRTTTEHNSRMISGNPNDYVSRNATRWVEPVTKIVKFENKLKACPSVFSFAKIGTNIAIYPYPENANPFASDRLIGMAHTQIRLFAFDQMNARLGPTKRVNVILIGFNDSDSMMAEYQKSAYIGGKKNDIVMCYGWSSTDKKVNWARVFGWSESEVCKRNLETILLENPINTDILSLIENEIRINYVIKDWKKFDYLAVEPQNKHFVWFFITMILTQCGLYLYFHYNEYTKDESEFKKESCGGWDIVQQKRRISNSRSSLGRQR